MRAAQGLGAALMIPAALSIVMNMFKEGAERNKALGIWGGLGAAGGTVGLIAGGLITRYVGWQYIFYLNVPIGAAALAARTPNRARQPARRFSAAVRPGRRDLGHRRSGAARRRSLTGSAVRLGRHADDRAACSVGGQLVTFLVIESRVEDPVVPLSIFRLRTLAAANLAALLLGGSFFAFVFAGTLYMQQVLHYSALQTGAAWLAASVTSMALAGVSQLLVTRIGAKVVMAIGMTLIGTGIVWATQVPVHAHFLANLAGPFVVAGAGTAFSFIPISVAALEGVASTSPDSPPACSTPPLSSGPRSGRRSPRAWPASGTNALLEPVTRHRRP